MKGIKKLTSLVLAGLLFSMSVFHSNAFTLERIQGKNKYETAGLIADKQQYTTVILINADSTMSDGLSASGLAGVNNAPIILTNGSTIPFSFDYKTIDSYVVGGFDNMTSELVTGTHSRRLGGADRYATNRKVIQTFYKGEEEFYIASGTDLVYPLIASTVVKDKPMILVNESSDKSILKGASKITVVGNLDESIIKKCLDAKDGKSETKTKKEKVYVEGFGWIEPGEGEGEVVDSDGDFNKIVADM
ncbi:TPA: DUF6550 family protein [Clostridioides difficile]